MFSRELTITSAAPWARTSEAFSSLPTTAMTRAPSAAAHCSAISPTPPAAACSRIH
jgi:hypothetical protein